MKRAAVASEPAGEARIGRGENVNPGSHTAVPGGRIWQEGATAVFPSLCDGSGQRHTSTVPRAEWSSGPRNVATSASPSACDSSLLHAPRVVVVLAPLSGGGHPPLYLLYTRHHAMGRGNHSMSRATRRQAVAGRYMSSSSVATPAPKRKNLLCNTSMHSDFGRVAHPRHASGSTARKSPCSTRQQWPRTVFPQVWLATGRRVDHDPISIHDVVGRNHGR